MRIRFGLAVCLALASGCERCAEPAPDTFDADNQRRVEPVLAAFDARVKECWDASVRAAIDDYDAGWDAYTRATFRAELLRPTASRHARVTEESATACADAITTAPCALVESDPMGACFGVSAWRGALPEGATCEHHGECTTGYCRHGFVFDDDDDPCGVCRPAPHGELVECHEWPCDDGLECTPGAQEDSAPVCREIAPVGRRCGESIGDASSRACDDGEVCSDGLCGPPPAVGDVCASTWPVCAAGLACIDDRCAAAIARGDPCGDGVAGECAVDDWCRVDGATGVCVARPLGGDACGDDVPCRLDAPCLSEFGDPEEAVGLPDVCVPEATLYAQENRLRTLRAPLGTAAFCVGCAPIVIVDDGACDVYAGPRVCKHAMTSRLCAAADGALVGACVDRPAAGDACAYLLTPCASPESACRDGTCLATVGPGGSCDAPCAYRAICDGGSDTCVTTEVGLDFDVGTCD